MMSRPSPRTQRRYGVSFSVANFCASSCETTASFIMPGSQLIRRRPDARARTGRRRGVGNGETLLRLDAHVDRRADRRAQRRMRAREQQALADLDLVIEIIAEEHLGVHRAAAQVVAVAAL